MNVHSPPPLISSNFDSIVLLCSLQTGKRDRWYQHLTAALMTTLSYGGGGASFRLSLVLRPVFGLLPCFCSLLLLPWLANGSAVTNASSSYKCDTDQHCPPMCLFSISFSIYIPHALPYRHSSLQHFASKFRLHSTEPPRPEKESKTLEQQ